MGRRAKDLILIAFITGILCIGKTPVFAGELDLSLVPEPIRYISVTGDDEKFQAHHWMKEDYVGGFDNVLVGYQDEKQKVTFDAEGHSLWDQDDWKGGFHLKKTDWGYVKVDYQQFPKYYDGTGGVYEKFTTLRAPELDKELRLNIGKLEVEAGITLEDLPNVIFYYEHSFKDGDKSLLNWADAREGAIAKKISPSFQDIDEVVDAFGIRVDHTIKGFELGGEQRWEFTHSKTMMEERYLSTNDVPSEKKIRDQYQEPETNLYTTMLDAKRWFLKDKVFLSSGYRYAHLNNREVESIIDLDENRHPFNFSNARTVTGAAADNTLNENTWVGSFMAIPKKWVSAIASIKTEAITREGNSTYPLDTNTKPVGPDGIIDRTDISNNDQRVFRVAESLSLRTTIIPRTAIYSDLELEQTKNNLTEDRNSFTGQAPASEGEMLHRKTMTNILRGTWTLGGRVSPWRWLDWTNQVRHRQNNIDYDDKFETVYDSGAKSAFFDSQNISTDEFSSRATLKFFSWLQPSFRYQYRGDRYVSRFENETEPVKNNMLSNIYTFDLIFQPITDLLMTGSFSRQQASVSTAARFSPIANTPRFRADVYTWLFAMDYTIIPQLAVTSTLQRTFANNFDDFSDTGLPLGASFKETNLTVGLRINVRKNIAIKPEYAFYQYKADNNVEIGNYNARGIFLTVAIG